MDHSEEHVGRIFGVVYIFSDENMHHSKEHIGRILGVFGLLVIMLTTFSTCVGMKFVWMTLASGNTARKQVFLAKGMLKELPFRLKRVRVTIIVSYLCLKALLNVKKLRNIQQYRTKIRWLWCRNGTSVFCKVLSQRRLWMFDALSPGIFSLYKNYTCLLSMLWVHPIV